MVQGYPEEDNSRSGFGCSLPGSRNAGKFFATPGTKAGIGFSAFLSYRTSNPGGYPHEQWRSYQSEKFKLRRFEKFGGETGGLMLNITGLNRFFFVRDFHDMRCKYDKVLSIIHQQLNREPEDGDVFIVMSKDLRLVRLFSYDRRSYSMFERRFRPGYQFMQVTCNGAESIYSINWRDVILLLESPVIKKLTIK